MNKRVLITGATSGIGEATAKLFAQHGYALILTGRRNERLEKLSKHLVDKYAVEVQTLCFDVREQQAVENALNSLPAEWKDIDILVNNAGLAAGKEAIQDGNRSNWERMIDTNVKGLLYISELIIPRMIAQKSGHIVNIGSIAGKDVYPGGNVYCASKFAVDALTQGMRQDLLPHNIKVSQVCPGMVETEFSIVRFDGDKEKAAAAYRGFEPLRAEDVADAIYYMASRPAHVCVNDMILMPTAQANSTMVVKAQ